MSVCHEAVMCKTAKETKVMLRVETLGDQRHIVLDGDPSPMRPLPNYFDVFVHFT